MEAVRTTLSDFESEDSGLDSLRRQIAAVRDRRVILESERGNALIAKEIRAAQADADTDAYAATAAQIRLLEEQIRLLSRDYMARERYLTLLAQMKVPEIVGGDAAQLLQYMPLSRALEIIGRVPDVNPPEVPELPESLDRGATRRALGQVDTTVPNASRVLDFLAGGRANLEADRRAAKQLVSLAPVIADLVAAAGAFRQRVVQHLAGEIGVRQFIEIGPDMLYGGSTHEIAQAADPSSRTVSVANDLVFLAHARTTFHLSRQGTRSHIDENILHPETIVAQAREILDFSRPIAILLIDSLGSVSGVADLRSMLDGLMAAMPSGSYLAIAQPASVPNSSAMAARRRWSEITGRPTAFRSREDLTSLVDGLELVEPGVVTAPDWRPDPDDQEFDGAIPLLGVLARKPAPAPILPITIYLDDEANHEQVETAVEELLAHVALEIVKRDDPVIGSWFRNLWAGVRQAGTSPVVRETALMAAHVADARLVLAQDAQTTNMLMQNLPPVLASLQCYQDAVLRVGALLIVKVGVRVDVIQLTAAQQAILDHRPQLACSPGEIVAALQLSSPQADGRDAT